MASMLLSVVGCKDDPVEEDAVVNVTDEPGKSSWDEIKIQKTFCVVGSENIPFFNELSERCEKYAGIDEAELVFVLGNSVSANSDALLEAYDRGAFIAVVAPDLEELEGWCDDNNIPFVANVDEKLMLYAFNNAARFYSLDALPEQLQTDDYSPMVNSFVSWIAKHNRMSRSMNADEIKSLFTTQSVTHAFNIGLKEEIAHVALSKADELEKYSTIDVSYNIYPMHAFNVPPVSAEGDYYAVESEVIAHNSNMYNGKWTQMHGWVHARLCGYYMSSLKTTSALMTQKGGKLSNVAFPAGASPKPETTVGSTSYTDSFSWSLNGTLSVGVAADGPQASLALGGAVEFGSSETRNVSDVNILKNATDGVVEYTYEIQNLPTSAGLEKDPYIPEVCRADLSLYSAWVWYVPNAKDNSKDQYKISISIVPMYKAYHWYSSQADFADYEFNAGSSTYTINLIAPSRIPTGQLTLTNTSKTHQYVRDIKIWETKNVGNDTPDYSLNGVIASSFMTSSVSNTEISTVLPVGDYTIQYTCYNVGADGKAIDVVTKQTRQVLAVGDTEVVDCGSGTF